MISFEIFVYFFGQQYFSLIIKGQKLIFCTEEKGWKSELILISFDLCVKAKISQ
jgi:hypothetical protein